MSSNEKAADGSGGADTQRRIKVLRAKQVYRREPSGQLHLTHVGAADPGLQAATEDQELADATLTEAQRLALKELVREVEAHRSSHELMFLAGAFEDAAIRKRAAEEASAR